MSGTMECVNTAQRQARGRVIMREVKDIVASLGTLAMWWVVGYSIQTAARLVMKDDGWTPQSSNASQEREAA